MTHSLRQIPSASFWTESDFSTLNEKYSPWIDWLPGKNICFEKSTQQFRLIEIHCLISTSVSDSQWSQSDSWKLESYRVDENVKFNLIQPFSSDFFNIWILSTCQDPAELQKKIESLPTPQSETDFLQHKMAWIIYWQNLILTNPNQQFDLTTQVTQYFQFLSRLKPEETALGVSGFDLQFPIQLCNEEYLVEWFQEQDPAVCWKALERHYLATQKLSDSALSFWKQYLSAPNPDILPEIQKLNHDFLNGLYQDWKKNADLNTDMNQFKWQNLKKVINNS